MTTVLAAARLTIRLACCLVVATALGCTEPNALATGAVTLTPPEQFKMWWALTESCSGLTGRFEDVTWYVVPGAASFDAGGVLAVGAYDPTARRITLASLSVTDPHVVRHEMLHALLGKTGGHPAQYFQTRCGGIVSCPDEECPPPAGPPPGAPVVPIRSLDVSTTVMLDTLDDGTIGRWAAITVSATSHSVVPVLVSLRADAFGTYYGWSYALTSGGVQHPPVQFLADSIAEGYAAGETKRYTFDVNLGAGDRRIVPGIYQFVGRFNTAASAPVTVVGPPRP